MRLLRNNFILLITMSFLMGCSGNLALRVMVDNNPPKESIPIDLYQDEQFKESFKTDSASGLVVMSKLSFNKSYRLEVNPKGEILKYSTVDTLIDYTRKIANDTVKISLGVNYTEVSGKVVTFDEDSKKYKPVFFARVFIYNYPSGEDIPIIKAGDNYADRTNAEGKFNFKLDMRGKSLEKLSGKTNRIKVKIKVRHPEYVTYSYPSEESINVQGKPIVLYKNNDIGRIIIQKK